MAAYLDRASRALSANPDRAEILADLEQAIADKCDTFLGKHKDVILATEALQIIREMGTVQGNGEEGGAAGGSEAAGAEAASGRSRRRRLMRLRDQLFDLTVLC